MTIEACLIIRAALTGKHDTLVRRAHQMLNAARMLILSEQGELPNFWCDRYHKGCGLVAMEKSSPEVGVMN